MKNTCKKCNSTQFTYSEIKHKNRAKYYRTCDVCGNTVRLNLEKDARLFFRLYCTGDAWLRYQNCEPKAFFQNVDEEAKRLRKENPNFIQNYKTFIVFLIRNQTEYFFHYKVIIKDYLRILQKYKAPLTEKDCSAIIDEIAEKQAGYMQEISNESK